ncbi:hypothetical protein [Streptomyces axinellae]|uniref:Uncharacterized protein n=1 Tax=Streptomyces axinellae TaxID=552788 RepID=A0ABN3Q9X2_9ACTN
MNPLPRVRRTTLAVTAAAGFALATTALAAPASAAFAPAAPARLAAAQAAPPAAQSLYCGYNDANYQPYWLSCSDEDREIKVRDNKLGERTVCAPPASLCGSAPMCTRPPSPGRPAGPVTPDLPAPARGFHAGRPRTGGRSERRQFGDQVVQTQ